jgi:EAL domain-containing protein (putative c-di-GMP-specific phosphodiesterase class I)
MTLKKASSSSSRLPRFLVVEKKKFNRRAMCRLIRAAGAEGVFEATDIWSANRLLGERHEHDWILIADPDTLGENGLELIKPLATEHPHARFILVCPRKPPKLAELHRDALARGLPVCKVMQKPVSVEEMVTVFSQLMESAAPNNARRMPVLSADDLNECLRSGRLHTRFQPKVNIESGRPSGCEAVAFIDHPRHGPVRVTELGAAATKHSGQRVITAAVLRDAAKMVRLIRAQKLDTKVSVSLSTDVLSEAGDATSLDSYVRTLGVMPSDLAFEITATPEVLQDGCVRSNLARLKVRGYSLVLCDSLASGVLEDPAGAHFSELKVNWANAASGRDAAKGMEHVEATIADARKHAIPACAAGLMAQTDLTQVRRLGFKYGQGEVFTAPLASEEALAWLGQHARAVSPAERTARLHRAG